MVDREEYFPFGETAFGGYGQKRYRYVGKERDEESGMYYYGARYYAPWVCRFVSVDPLAGKFKHLTPYQNAGNKVINQYDIDGLQGNEETPNSHSEKKPYLMPKGGVVWQGGLENEVISDEKVWMIDFYIKEKQQSVEVVQGALKSFDYKGKHYKANFSTKDLSFTGYKSDGEEFIFDDSGEDPKIMLGLKMQYEFYQKNDSNFVGGTLETYGNRGVLWNDKEFSFNGPVDFNKNTDDLGASASGEWISDLNGSIELKDFDHPLDEQLSSLDLTFTSSSAGIGKGKISVDLGLNTVLASDPHSGKSVFFLTQESLSAGGGESVNPLPFDVGFGKAVVEFKPITIPNAKDSIRLGY